MTAKPGSEQAASSTSEDDADQDLQAATSASPDDFFPDFAASWQQLSLLDLAAAVKLLRSIQKRPALSSLEAREAFQRRLIRALAHRELGRHSALLFFAALEVFGWDRHFPPARNHTGDAHAWQQVNRWIDAACTLGPEEHRMWRSFATAPNRETLDRNLGDTEPLDWSMPLHSLCCGPDEVQEWQRLDLLRWHELSSASASGTASAPPSGHAPRPAASPVPPVPPVRSSPSGRRSGKQQWRSLSWSDRLYAVISNWKIMAPFLLFLGIGASLWGDERKKLEYLEVCTQQFQKAALAGFKGLTISDLEELQQCTYSRYRPTCAEKAALDRLDVVADVLKDTTSGVRGFSLQGLRPEQLITLFPADDPVTMAYTGQACTSEFTDFVARGGWLRLGDETLARRVTAEAARCWTVQKQQGENPAAYWRDPWALQLLSRTDVWQDVAKDTSSEVAQDIVQAERREPRPATPTATAAATATAGIRIPLTSLMARDPRMAQLDKGGSLPTKAACPSDRVPAIEPLRLVQEPSARPSPAPLRAVPPPEAASAAEAIAKAVKIMEQERLKKSPGAP